MSEDEFIKTISHVVVSFEKAGVYDDNLKQTIDSLFALKDIIYIRNAVKENNQTCSTCKSYDNGICKTLFATTSNGEIKIGLFGSKNIHVSRSWSCKYFNK